VGAGCGAAAIARLFDGLLPLALAKSAAAFSSCRLLKGLFAKLKLVFVANSLLIKRLWQVLERKHPFS